MSEYSAEVLRHFRAPHGPGRIARAEGGVSGEARDAEGGQRVRLHLRVGADRCIALARFQAFGCPIAIAAASAVIARIEGQSVERALAIRAQDLARELALSPDQARLAELPLAALRAALAYARAPA